MKKRKFKTFQIRWAEEVGDPKRPYLKRWVFIFFGFSLRIHHWTRSDDHRAKHDHAWNFITIVLKGKYYDVGKDGGIMRPFRPVFRKYNHKHWVQILKGEDCWTLLLCGRPKNKWAFYPNGNRMRPLRYFSRFGHH